MKTLCNIVLILAAAAATARAQYTYPLVETSISCADINGNPCGSWSFSNAFYDYYAETDGSCADSSTPTVYTYPSATATVGDNNACPAMVSTSMTAVPRGASSYPQIDAVDARVSENIGGYYFASAENELGCDYSSLVDTSGSTC
jgi:hypothetical protein